MEKYFDEKIIGDEEAKLINSEFEKLSNQMNQSFVFYQQKIIMQNIINIVSEICINFYQSENDIKNLEGYLSQKNKKILIKKYNKIKEQQKILSQIYQSDILNEKFVPPKNCFVHFVSSLCNVIKLYTRLIGFEKNNDVQKIIRDFIMDIADIVIFVTSAGSDVI